MRQLGSRAAAVVAAGLLAGAADAAPVIDGSIGPNEWDDTPTLTPPATATVSGGAGIEVLIQSDPNNLYILGNTTDDDLDDPLDVFDVNIGLHGNTAPWRYRVLAKNNGAADPGAGTTEFIVGDWFGNFQGGDDTGVVGSFGEPDMLMDLGIAASGVQWAVGVDDGNRVHEIAIPWDVLLDGANGWVRSAALELAIAGTYLEDGAGTGYPTGLDFADQDTYAKVTVDATSVPEPGVMPLLAGAAGGFAWLRRRRKV